MLSTPCCMWEYAGSAPARAGSGDTAPVPRAGVMARSSREVAGREGWQGRQGKGRGSQRSSPHPDPALTWVLAGHQPPAHLGSTVSCSQRALGTKSFLKYTQMSTNASLKLAIRARKINDLKDQHNWGLCSVTHVILLPIQRITNCSDNIFSGANSPFFAI